MERTSSIKPLPYAPSDSEVTLPIQRAKVYSDESSLQSCGSVSSCFNWIYSFLASIWNALFGAAVPEKPKFDEKLWKRLCEQPEELAKELVDGPDFQAAFIQLFDHFAKLDDNLIPCPEMLRFINELGKKRIEQKGPEPTFSIPYQMLANLVENAVIFPITKESAPHLVAIAKDRAIALILKFPSDLTILMEAIPADPEKLKTYEAESNRLFKIVIDQPNKKEETLPLLARNLILQFAMSKICQKPILLPENIDSVLDEVAAAILFYGQEYNGLEKFHQTIATMVKLFESQPSPLSESIKNSAELIKDQPPLTTLKDFCSFTPGIETRLHYRYTDTNIYNSMSRLLELLEINDGELTAVFNVKNPQTDRNFANFDEFIDFIDSDETKEITIGGRRIQFWTVHYNNTGFRYTPPNERSLPAAFLVCFKQENPSSPRFYAPLTWQMKDEKTET